MVDGHFRGTGAHEAAQGLSDPFNIRLRNDKVQDSDVRWDQALLSASETATEMVLEGLYKSTLQDSVQLQTLSALDDQETIQNNGQPSYPKLKTSVRLHVDQTMRTQNFKAQNETVDTGATSKGRTGKKAYFARKVRECVQWKAKRQCSEGDLCSFTHDPVSGNRYED